MHCIRRVRAPSSRHSVHLIRSGNLLAVCENQCSVSLAVWYKAATGCSSSRYANHMVRVCCCHTGIGQSTGELCMC